MPNQSSNKPGWPLPQRACKVWAMGATATWGSIVGGERKHPPDLLVEIQDFPQPAWPAPKVWSRLSFLPSHKNKAVQALKKA